jgi:hypothetical protein
MTIKAETKSNNIHVFRVNREAKNKDLPTNTISPVTVNSRTSLSAETKRLICEDHIENPKYTQEALAKKYGCKRTTIAKVETINFVILQFVTLLKPELYNV